ncbi:MAG: diguanylate cyclase [Proteobacteria bacterium]|nr:diguanylate cyclase [Pseudomonadota bacterium]MBU1649669.1 diguanylate cyclase [Pseudomonadota bacterium]
MKTLQAKIIVQVICLIVGAQLVTGLLILSQVEKAMHHENHQLGLALAYDLAHVCARSLISQDLAELRNYIRYTMSQEYVTQAMVVDNDCRILMHNKLEKVGEKYKGTCPEQGQYLFSEHYTNEAGETVMDVLAPIAAGGVQLGTAILSYSHIGIKNAVKILTRDIILIFSIGSLLAIFFAILLAEYVSRPIRHLSRAAKELGSGHFHIKKMDTEYNDEIGVLARSFYEMADKLETEVCHDALTSLYTRNVFQIRLVEEYARSQRNNIPFAVLMLDVDHFKMVNDTHGHEVGDEVLRHIAANLIGQTRGSDCAARYGGEEFIILLPETHRRAALHVAEKIRLRIETDPFLLLDGRKIQLTISIGIARFPEDTSDYNRLISMADQAMYKAKENGRNTVVEASHL